MTKAPTGKRRRRPKRLEMPPPIPDTLESVIDAVVSTPPRKPGEWRFMQEHEKKYRAKGGTHGANSG